MAAKMYGKGKTAIESDEQQKLRWQVELEFVQSLANPNYLNFIAQRGYFKDQAFINYIRYLQYWKEPNYAKYLMYPMCLYFLDLLQYEHFRREIVSSQCCKFIDEQALLQWQHYSRQRVRMVNAGGEIEQQPSVDAAQPQVTAAASAGGAPTAPTQVEAALEQPAQQPQQEQQKQQATAQKSSTSSNPASNGLGGQVATPATPQVLQQLPPPAPLQQAQQQPSSQHGSGVSQQQSQQQMNGLSASNAALAANIKLELS